MRKYLLSETGNFYKANLHCHTTLSDACLTPGAVKGAYMAHGYSIVAFTDHDILLDHNDLTDSRFLALNGFELEVREDYKYALSLGRCNRQCHICLIALEPDNLTQVCYHREKYLFGNAPAQRDKLVVDESQTDYVRTYSIECINDMIKRCREAGFFVTYNHPSWSYETYEQYAYYEGMHAMEICNYSGVSCGFGDYYPQAYDDILRTGKRIYCIAADDNHNGPALTSPRSDSFGGFTMIKADALEYRTVTSALMAGNFYASQGPEIYDLYYEDGKLFIKCSDARRIFLTTGMRRCTSVAAEQGKHVNEASFVLKETDIYARITVEDSQGRCADTNAYFIDELMDLANKE